MNKETQSIIKNFNTTLSGQPWFGRPVYEILEETDTLKVYTKPNDKEHSLIELLYHMITWAEFTLSRLDASSSLKLAASEDRDWRKLDPAVHTWAAGIKEFKEIHQKIIAILETKEDAFLSEMVKERKYNFRFLLNGLIQHNIYHLGQIAYLKKTLA
jgi:uncharacterized damage-inducible protein DinB